MYTNFRSLPHKVNCIGVYKLSAWFMIALAFSVGAFLRFDGISSHVTYIDELIVLTEGEWNSKGREDSYTSDSSLEFTKKIAEHKGVTYAPLQFMLTFQFIKDNKPLSLESVSRARIPSAIFGCLSLIVLLFIMLTINNGRVSYSCIFPLTLLSVSLLAIINSQQTHTYSIGLFAAFIVIAVLTHLANSRNIYLIIALAAVLSLVPLANYLVIPVMLSSIGFCIFYLFVKSHRDKQWQNTSYTLICLSIPILISIAVSVWVIINKPESSIPWWVKDNYALQENVSYSLFELSKIITNNLGGIIEALLLNGEVKLFNSLSVIVTSGVVITGSILYIKSRITPNLTALPLLISYSGLAILLALFINRTIALAPSRHALIFMPIVLLSIFYCLLRIEFFCSQKKWSTYTFNLASILICLVLLYSGISNNYITATKKKEVITAETILNASKTAQTKTVVTNYYTYDKLYLQLEEHIKAGDITLEYAAKESEFPPPPFMLVGSNLKREGVFWPGGYRRHKSKVLFEYQSGYDMEPSPKVTYWPNEMVIYLIERR